MVDAGLDQKRAKEISSHESDSMFDRYNIGKREDIEAARKAVEGYYTAVTSRDSS